MGEQLAAEHYESTGGRVLARNFRTRWGEVDLIVRQGGCLVFAEVKTRNERALARPAEWVDVRKQRKIILAAQQYAADNNLGDEYMRFDVVEVLLPKGGLPTINRIENAFSL